MKTTFLFLCVVFNSLFFDLSAQDIIANETSMKAYLDSGRHDPIEGIYKSMGGAYYRIAIKKVADNKYVAVVLDMDPKLRKHWKVGDVKAKLEKSSIPQVYSIRWIWNDKTPQETVARFENNGILKMDYLWESIKYLKVYPTTAMN